MVILQVERDKLGVLEIDDTLIWVKELLIQIGWETFKIRNWGISEDELRRLKCEHYRSMAIVDK